MHLSIMAFSEAAVREPQYSEYHRKAVPPPVYLNDLTQDCVGGTEAAEFLVNLPPGKYQAWVLAGFADRFPVTFTRFKLSFGDGVADTISIPQRYIFERRVYSFEVAKPPLSIKVEPETGWLLDALVIYPHADANRAQGEQLATIEQEIFALPQDMWAKRSRVPNPKANPPMTPSPADEARGYILFDLGYAHNVFPDSAPTANDVLSELSTFATPGEYEPITLSIYPLRQLTDMRVTASDLKCPTGSIPATSIAVLAVRTWFVREQYGTTGRYKQVPEMLVSPEPRSLPSRECQRYWLTVKVPRDPKPGTYEGTVIVFPSDAPATKLPIRLDVLPFTLKEDPTKSFGMYYYDPRAKIVDKDSASVKAAITERARRECEDMREHGMNTIQLSGVRLKTIEKKRKYEVGFTELDANIKWYRENGVLSRPSMLGFWMVQSVYKDFTGQDWPKHIRDIPPGPSEFYDIVTDLVQQVETARKGHPDWPEFYYYPIDEASDEAAEFMARMLQAIKRVPGAKTFVTQIFDKPASAKFAEWVDVWCTGWYMLETDDTKRAREKGQIFWCYPNFIACSRGVPNGARMTWGFGFWRSGASCLIPWHYQAPCGNPFNDFDANYGDWCVAYPGPDGPIPTQRWEAVREGIDDYRYVYTLETLCTQAEKSGKGVEAARAARQYLKELRDRVQPQQQYVENFSTQTAPGLWTHKEYQAARRTIAEHIMKLLPAL
jgi:hypothetical protein